MPQDPLKPLSLLLVEDSDDDAILILEELRGAGFAPSYERVYTRPGMRRALLEGEWDVIISDHNLPGFSATDSLLLLLESHRDIPFIIVSGTIGEELAVEAMKAGAHDFVMKDSLGKLGPAVRNAIDGAEARRAHHQAQGEIQESRERLRQLASHLETVREEERARLAREIHDELGGILTALKMDIAWLKRNIPAESRVEAKFASMTDLTDAAIRSMRRIITELRPSILDDLGLVAAIEWQLSEFEKRMGIRGELILGRDPDVTAIHLPESHAVALFRIFQESLTNVARHADASRVWVRVWGEGGRFNLEVHDNGRGIDPHQTKKTGSYGILGMHERAHNLGAALTISGGPGEGTTIRLSVPLDTATEGAE